MRLLNILIFFLLGLIFGSFLNSLIYRIYHKLSIWQRSFCPKCKKILKIKDLVPLFSYIWLKARCRSCQERISRQYFRLEAVVGILFVLFFIKYGTIDLFLIRDLFFVLILIFIFVFDWKYYLILDKIIWPALIAIVIINLYLGFGILNLLLGILIGGSFFLIQYLLTRAKGIGWGDVILGLLLGAMLGWQLVILNIVSAYIIGGLVAGYSLISKKKKIGDILPMGTFLSAAAIIILLIGDRVINWYF